MNIRQYPGEIISKKCNDFGYIIVFIDDELSISSMIASRKRIDM